jgi:hypothetical protein
MKRTLLILLFLLCAVAFAQQSATVSGIIKTDKPLPANARVSIEVINADGVWKFEVASAVPAAGTFSVTAKDALQADLLRPFRSGAVPLLGIQDEYSVSPSDVNFARANVEVYVDNNGNGKWDGLQTDSVYLGVPSLEKPVGFFELLYVDKDATISSQGVSLKLKRGWNIFTFRVPSDGQPTYAITQKVDDAKLDVFPANEPPPKSP